MDKQIIALKRGKQSYFIHSLDKLLALFKEYRIPYEKENLLTPFPVKIPEPYARSLLSGAKTEKEKIQIRNILVINETFMVQPSNGMTYSFFDEYTHDKDVLKGLTQMYPDRILISPTGVCPMHCPWCFRKPQREALTDNELNAIFNYIQKNRKIEDVILTGGEPLFLSIGRIEKILKELRAIPHVKIIRFHTRAPIVIPEILIKNKAIETIGKYNLPGKPIYVIVQVVHYLEINDLVLDIIYKIRKQGILVLNQSPVLRDVNDDQETFNRWLKAMIHAGIKPYYVNVPVVRPNVNEYYFVPYSKVLDLVTTYSAEYDGLGRPTIIVAVMGKKLSSFQLKQEMMKKEGIHFRNTKAEKYDFE